ncbi:hypothetical protein FOA52_014861 [Chlamydomonas sp. UWO 241]|nr:hypothetical protein FOA52_014861 [Chlamydomonas sp. UWO 241]
MGPSGRGAGSGSSALQKCQIELPDDAEQYGTKTLTQGYIVDKQIGEGTYGKVYLGNDKNDQTRVALKQIKMVTERDGFPITAIREIKLLSVMSHRNVINLREIVRTEIHKSNNYQGSIFMVFDFCENDLSGITQSHLQLSESQVKCIMKQLLTGLAYVHGCGVLHRDIKAANILIDRNGIVKIADFGLARSKPIEDSDLTNLVITLWYRPPELLLGSTSYGLEIDMWSIGCLFAELLTGKPLFPGSNEPDQIDKIFKTLGMPTKATWPGYSLVRDSKMVPMKYKHGSQLRKRVNELAARSGPGAVNNVQDGKYFPLLKKMLTLDPTKRVSALDAFTDDYFWHCDPPPCDPKNLPCHGSSHEFTMKKRRNEERERAYAHMLVPGPSGGGGDSGVSSGAGRGPPAYDQPDAKRARFGVPPGGAAAGGSGVGAGRVPPPPAYDQPDAKRGPPPAYDQPDAKRAQFGVPLGEAAAGGEGPGGGAAGHVAPRAYGGSGGYGGTGAPRAAYVSGGAHARPPSTGNGGGVGNGSHVPLSGYAGGSGVGAYARPPATGDGGGVGNGSHLPSSGYNGGRGVSGYGGGGGYGVPPGGGAGGYSSGVGNGSHPPVGGYNGSYAGGRAPGQTPPSGGGGGSGVGNGSHQPASGYAVRAKGQGRAQAPPGGSHGPPGGPSHGAMPPPAARVPPVLASVG